MKVDQFLKFQRVTKKIRGDNSAFTIKKNNKLCNRLFNYNADPEYQWSCLEQLETEYNIFSIKLAKDHHYLDVKYENSKLIFNKAQDASGLYMSEVLVREWLQRPIISADIKHWNQLLSINKNCFEDGGLSLTDKPIKPSGWSAEQIMQGLISIGQVLQTPQTLRQLSSQCFFSESKFLDNRQVLIEKLYPSLLVNLITRPVILNCYIPNQFHEVLFIENQDTFIKRVNSQPENQLLIYSAGFRATMKSVRTEKGVVFSLVESEFEQVVFEQFKQWWFGKTDKLLPCYFYGDLDYSGLGILGQLRKQFPNIEAWKPGYELLLEKLKNGYGHTPEQSNKQGQKMPDLTGSQYADKVLLVALKKYLRFVDQEAD
ncbi:Wadjet anti-phage system protein JetD domain-containing protein [sulfur-oxidizing endosymbiont of Gigantopelta aegis]|uniref:Wadjet anti-phage system protein JetD domain-containing protein n=1 Tax=sulfur-oxidizing endosymbiont of Gigantopelta aegis TaxID=2794934 RepID=UPI0018DB317E|nr:Wadjet anti-phage system protein JetD domain-containing protein [sulfur-oxidizing endosymbiont of Gigantopelta aegis]